MHFIDSVSSLCVFDFVKNKKSKHKKMDLNILTESKCKSQIQVLLHFDFIKMYHHIFFLKSKEAWVEDQLS